MINSIRGSIKRSLIVKDSLCDFRPMQHVTRSHMNLIEDLLHEQYQFVLTERLQNDLVDRRLGLYSQMSDGCFSIPGKGYIRKY